MTAISQVRARVISNTPVMPAVRLVWLESSGIASLAQPGQFVMVGCGPNSLLRRPLSIHRTSEDKARLALMFAVVGKGTSWLAQRQAGDKVDLLGPLGNGFTIQPESRNLLLLAGGMGVAPLNFLAIEAQKAGYGVTLCQGAKTKFHVVKEEHKPAMVTSITITEDGTAGRKGMVTECLPELSSRADQVFACGPTAMYRAMALKRQELLGTKPVQISLEVRMACGLGVCYGCAVKTKKGLKQVCQDGPVFELDGILWDEFVEV